MGVGVGDFDADGWLDIVRTNFSEQVTTLYRNYGGALRGRQHQGRPRREPEVSSASAWASSTSTTTAGRTSSSRTATCTRRSPAGSCTSPTGSRRSSTAIWATGASKTCPRRPGRRSGGESRPRLRVRRFRQRRRRGRDRQQPGRPPIAAAQRRREQEQLDHDQVRGHALEPVGHRDPREGHQRRAHARSTR